MSCCDKVLYVTAGKTWTRLLSYVVQKTGVPISLAGLACTAEVRADFNAPLLLKLTSAGGDIVIDGDAGQVTVTISAADSAALSPDNSRRELKIGFEFYDAVDSNQNVFEWAPIPLIVVPGFVQ